MGNSCCLVPVAKVGMMARRVALLFPGQGSQYVGMGKDLWDHFALARETFQEASDAIHEDLARLCFQGPDERLRLTTNAQPTILTVSIAAMRVLRSELPMAPVCAAGHSVGEYAALVATGAISLPDAVRLVRQRGQFMQEAVAQGVGTMAALLGLEEQEVDALCGQHAGSRVVVPANYNGPGQVVISGHTDAVELVCKAVRERKGCKAIPLHVSGPFHSPLMIPAADRLRPELRKVPVQDLAFDVLSNVDALPYPSEGAIEDLLARQVSHPVRWHECMKEVSSRGVQIAIELGPKKVLVGLMKRIAPGMDTAQVEDEDGLRGALRMLS